MFPTLN